jgi:copper homeostasis protein CutC
VYIIAVCPPNPTTVSLEMLLSKTQTQNFCHKKKFKDTNFIEENVNVVTELGYVNLISCIVKYEHEVDFKLPCDICWCSKEYRTVLHKATEVVHVLIDSGAVVDMKDSE